MFTFLSNKSELCARPHPETSEVAPSQYEPGMRLVVAKFPWSLFPIQSNDSKKRYLAISDSQILEVVEIPSSIGTCQILNIHQLQSLAKMQIRKGKNSVVFQFRSGISRAYNTAAAVACCECIRKEMKSSGVEANVWSPVVESQVSTGYELLESVYQLEERFNLEPSFQLLQSMMTITREAVECLGEAHDERHVKALRHMQDFLTRADVIELLDSRKGSMREGSYPLDEGIHLDYNHIDDDATKLLSVVTGEGFTTHSNSAATRVSGHVTEDAEDLRLERELHELIGALDEELKSIL